MASKPTSTPPGVPKRLLPVSESGSANAPIIYFEHAPAFGYNNGMLKFTLTADRIFPGADKPVSDLVIVAHLRTTIQSAIYLRDAINAALLLATPAESEVKN